MRSFSDMWYDPVGRKKIFVFGGGGLLFVTVLIIIIVVTTSGSKQEYFAGHMVLDEVPLIDGHNDLARNLYLRENNLLENFNFTDLSQNPKWNTTVGGVQSHTDLTRLALGKVRGQFWVASADCKSNYKDAVELTLEQIDVIKRLINKYKSSMKLVTKADEIMEAFWEGKIASLISVKGGHSIDSRLSMLRLYYELGVRYMTLTGDCNTPWIDSRTATVNQTVGPNGLTDFGKDVILEMNRIGMMVDISHVSTAAMKEALNTSKAPVIFSHSAANGAFQSNGNVDDEVLASLKANKGVIMLNFGSAYLGAVNVTVHTVIAHLDYIRNKTGSTDHVGIGADYDGSDSVPIGLEDVSKYPYLFDELATQTENHTAWNREDLKKLASGNILRVMREVEKYRDSKEIAVKEAAISPADLRPTDTSCRSDYVAPTSP